MIARDKLAASKHTAFSIFGIKERQDHGVE